MRPGRSLQSKLFTPTELLKAITRWRLLGKTIAFTNGCFDILHAGHIQSLSEAAATADILIVALNADASVKKLKGPSRPVNSEQARATVMSALAMVDAVVIFEEDTPLELIKFLKPDVLVKGGDYTVDQIAGAAEVISWGGRVVINPILAGYSTTGIIKSLQSPNC